MAYQQAVRQREGLFLPTKSTHKIELLLLNLQKKKINQTTKEIKEGERFMYNRVSQKNQKSEFYFATNPTGFQRLDEPPEKISAL